MPEAHVTYQGGYIMRFSREHGLTKKGFLDRPFYFQVGPTDDLRFTASATHNDYTVLARRQVSRPVSKDLLQVSFRSVFLDYQPEWASYEYRNFPDNGPIDFVTRIRGQLRQLGAIHVNLGNPFLYGRWEVDMPMTLRQADVTEQAGEPDARYIDIQLVEFDEAELDTREKGRRRAQEERATIVTVFRGGRVTPFHIKGPPTLAKIAQQVYQTHKAWSFIAKVNNIKGWTANRDLTDYVKKVRGRDSIKLRCPGKLLATFGDKVNTLDGKQTGRTPAVLIP